MILITHQNFVLTLLFFKNRSVQDFRLHILNRLCEKHFRIRGDYFKL